MTKDFKNKQNAEAPFNDVVSWILAGIALGLFIGLMLYIFSGNSSPSSDVQVITDSQEPVSSNPLSPQTVSNNALASRDVTSKNSQPNNGKSASMNELDQIIEDNLGKNEEDSRPIFDYHVILPTLDVEVAVTHPTEWKKEKKNDRKPTKERKKEKKDKPKKVAVEEITKPGNYIIQVGAYKKRDEANSMKKRVDSIANAYVEKSVIKGKKWYRVRIGPISDLNKVNSVRAQLSSKGIASFKKSIK